MFTKFSFFFSFSNCLQFFFRDTGHIEWHLEVGLAMQFIEAPLQVQQRNKIPQASFSNCKALGQRSSGNAAGHKDPFDLRGLPRGPFIKNPQPTASLLVLEQPR